MVLCVCLGRQSRMQKCRKGLSEHTLPSPPDSSHKTNLAPAKCCWRQNKLSASAAQPKGLGGETGRLLQRPVQGPPSPHRALPVPAAGPWPPLTLEAQPSAGRPPPGEQSPGAHGMWPPPPLPEAPLLLWWEAEVTARGVASALFGPLVPAALFGDCSHCEAQPGRVRACRGAGGAEAARGWALAALPRVLSSRKFFSALIVLPCPTRSGRTGLESRSVCPKTGEDTLGKIDLQDVPAGPQLESNR